MHRLAIAAAALFFFLNPGFGCSADQDGEFQYGELEMKAAVEGTWVLTLGEATDPTKEEITLRVTQSREDPTTQTQVQRRTGLVRSAVACSNRSFVASANACVDSSSMPLDVTMVSGPDGYKDAQLSGNLGVHSLIFSQGFFYLSFGTVFFDAQIAPDGTVKSVQRYLKGGGPLEGAVSLVRTATPAN